MNDDNKEKIILSSPLILSIMITSDESCYKFISSIKNKVMPFPYSECTLEKRSKICRDLQIRYPTFIPVLVEMIGKELTKSKYLVPQDVPISRLLYTIRSENKINQYEGLFLFTNNHLIVMSHSVLEIYSRHASQDGFLYVTVAVENTFGWSDSPQKKN